MRLFGIAGTRNSGKTTLVVGLVRALTARGVSVATIKQSGRDTGPPAEPTGRMLAAGAAEAAVVTSSGWVLTGATAPEAEPTPAMLAARLGPADLVLVEGSRTPGYPRIEVWRPETGRAPLWPNDPDIVAIAATGTVAGTVLPVLDLNDIRALAEVVLTASGMSGGGTTGHGQ